MHSLHSFAGPYTATKAFIGRQAAFISNMTPFGSFGAPSTLSLKSLASVPLLMQVNSMSPTFLPYSMNSDLSVRKNRVNKVRRCTKLSATTEDADVATPVKEKRIKKVGIPVFACWFLWCCVLSIHVVFIHSGVTVHVLRIHTPSI